MIIYTLLDLYDQFLMDAAIPRSEVRGKEIVALRLDAVGRWR